MLFDRSALAVLGLAALGACGGRAVASPYSATDGAPPDATAGDDGSASSGSMPDSGSGGSSDASSDSPASSGGSSGGSGDAACIPTFSDCVDPGCRPKWVCLDCNCVECVDDTGCPPPTICRSDHRCGCFDDSQCAGLALGTHCLPSSMQCGCATDSDCKASPTAPHCTSTGTCGCGSNADCDGGAACRTEAPTYHRPSASACPSHETDAGADSGIVGCMPPHDACLIDSDCGASGVCECESPRCTQPFATTGNVCLPGNCRVDSDCACGFCAGDLSCGGLDGYWCTTPLDECSTDADCKDGGAGSQCRWSTDHWACVRAIGCPG